MPQRNYPSRTGITEPSKERRRTLIPLNCSPYNALCGLHAMNCPLTFHLRSLLIERLRQHHGHLSRRVHHPNPPTTVDTPRRREVARRTPRRCRGVSVHPLQRKLRVRGGERRGRRRRRRGRPGSSGAGTVLLGIILGVTVLGSVLSLLSETGTFECAPRGCVLVRAVASTTLIDRSTAAYVSLVREDTQFLLEKVVHVHVCACVRVCVWGCLCR